MQHVDRSYGGANKDGTIFKITPSGTLTTLDSFDGSDGAGPAYASLIQAVNGDLYGTTEDGGVSGGDGTVFKISPSGTLTTLHSFDGTDGHIPGVLVQATDGNIYGTTGDGGNSNTSCSVLGCGTIFKITPSGTLTTLHRFCSQSGCPDGNGPGGLVQAADGNFYGTTAGGGNYGKSCPTLASFGCGTFFKMTPTGKLTTLYSFCSQTDCTDGFSPEGLTLATDGNFYGTNFFGGANCAPDGCGTIFVITPGGALTTLHAFCSQAACVDGSNPGAGLVQDTNGDFYGTTEGGGTGGQGTVFSLSVGLGPFVETRPTYGKVGQFVEILGTDLTGATSVTFNGAAADFKVVAGSVITTSVPAGATTGKVQVVIPSGTLTSNVVFRVRP
jgi:uncharacterized repeat protein (TIGR03803 family)